MKLNPRKKERKKKIEHRSLYLQWEINSKSSTLHMLRKEITYTWHSLIYYKKETKKKKNGFTSLFQRSIVQGSSFFGAITTFIPSLVQI